MGQTCVADMKVLMLFLIFAVIILPIFGYLTMLREDCFEAKKLGMKSKIVLSLEVISLVLLTALCLV